MARIVRGLFDVTGRLSQCTDTETMVEARRQLDMLRARTESLGDPSFTASFDAALVRLLPDTPDRGQS